MTLEEAIDSIHSSGYRVMNLFETGVASWQANLHDGEKVWEFGQGGSPIGALMSALHKTTTSPSSPYHSKSKYIPSTILDDIF